MKGGGKTVSPGGWRSAIQAPVGAPIPTKHRDPKNPIPGSLAEFAPLLLECPVCSTLRLARPDRTLLWHQTARDGVLYECVAVGLPGLDPETQMA